MRESKSAEITTLGMRELETTRRLVSSMRWAGNLLLVFASVSFLLSVVNFMLPNQKGAIGAFLVNFVGGAISFVLGGLVRSAASSLERLTRSPRSFVVALDGAFQSLRSIFRFQNAVMLSGLGLIVFGGLLLLIQAASR